jgi:dienelactone hydrolase
VRQGFAVFVPTRLGYGGSAAFSGPLAEEVDPEDSGNCREEDYAGALNPAVEEIAATLNYARQQAYVDASRHFVVGQSVGGAATVAYGATRPAGLIGYVNFGGGIGGDPLQHPGVPCQAESLARLYTEFGKSTLAPSLWIYAENDRYFAPGLVRAWHGSFAAGGSPSQLILLAPFAGDGHRLLADGLAHWRPLLDDELSRLGLHVSPPPERPRPSGYAAIQDATHIPWSSSTARAQGYASFLASALPRAFAVSESGNWGWASGPEEPANAALAYCNRTSSKPCVIYAIDNAVIWSPQEPVTDKTLPAKQP